jgi:hypothetical protein
MNKIKEITYPITVYSISDSNCFPFGDGQLHVKTFNEPPKNYDSHQIKDGKFIWMTDGIEGRDYYEFYINKEKAKKIALEFTKKRLKEYQEKVVKLKKQLKEIRAL